MELVKVKRAGVDFMSAVTFNNVPEAVGVARAAASVGLPLYISFTLDSNHRLKSGLSLKEAIESVDAEAGDGGVAQAHERIVQGDRGAPVGRGQRLVDVGVRSMSRGGGLVMWARKPDS